MIIKPPQFYHRIRTATTGKSSQDNKSNDQVTEEGVFPISTKSTTKSTQKYACLRFVNLASNLENIYQRNVF